MDNIFFAIFMHFFRVFWPFKYIFGSIWPISGYNTERETIKNQPRDETSLKYQWFSKKLIRARGACRPNMNE